VHQSASGVAKVLTRHRLATRRARVAAFAMLTAVDTGLVASRPDGVLGVRPGRVSWWGSTASTWGKLKGIGPVHQLTAVDTATRWAICELVVGHVTGEVAAAFVRHVAEGFLARSRCSSCRGCVRQQFRSLIPPCPHQSWTSGAGEPAAQAPIRGALRT
jgi:hypothetical protein